MGPEVAVQLVGGVTGLGLVAWLVKHTFTKTIPRLAEDFKTMLAGQQASFTTAFEKLANELQLQRREFLGELRYINDANREERAECLERMRELQARIEKLTDEVRSQ